jgi:methyl-accepting chemotaxis protein
MNPSDSNKRRTKNLVIEKQFQYRFALGVCIFGGLLLFSFGGMLLYVIKLNFDMLAQNALLQMPTALAELRREHRLLSLALLVVLIILIGILFALGLLLTHRIAGPLFALQNRLLEFGNGKRGVRLKIRKEDEFKKLEEVFNESMLKFEDRIQGLEQRVTDLVSDPTTKEKIQKEFQNF